MPVSAPSAAVFTADFGAKDDQWIRWLLKLTTGDKIDVVKYSEKYKVRQWAQGEI